MLNDPTEVTYNSLTAAYDFFNRELFSRALPACLITMQRHKGSLGYFCSKRFAKMGEAEHITDEIALNPATFNTQTVQQILSTLAHEMVHLWQHHCGEPPRGGYHDREWANKMLEIGLIPTATGQIGGKQTGQKMSDMIQENGVFQKTCERFLAENPVILFHDRAGSDTDKQKKKRASKTKYACPDCGVNAWGKPGLNIWCGDCHLQLKAEIKDED